MTNLLRTEWLKIKHYRAFWWIIGLTALSYPGINYIFFQIYKEITREQAQSGEIMKFLVGNPFAFPETWHTVAYFSSFFVFIPAVVVIMFITNEYGFKTNRQNIIDGWSRSEFMSAKMLDVLMITLLITLLYIIVSAVTGFLNMKEAAETAQWWHQTKYIALFALQTFSQLSIAFLVGFLVRKAFVALAIFLFYFIIFENIIVGLLTAKANDEGRFLPIEISDRMIPAPTFWGRFAEERYKELLESVNYHIIYTVIFTTLIWLLCYRINQRRDL